MGRPVSAAPDSRIRPVVPLTEDVSWIAESYGLPDGRNVHVSVYLIRSGMLSGLLRVA